MVNFQDGWPLPQLLDLRQKPGGLKQRSCGLFLLPAGLPADGQTQVQGIRTCLLHSFYTPNRLTLNQGRKTLRKLKKLRALRRVWICWLPSPLSALQGVFLCVSAACLCFPGPSKSLLAADSAGFLRCYLLNSGLSMPFNSLTAREKEPN